MPPVDYQTLKYALAVKGIVYEVIATVLVWYLVASDWVIAMLAMRRVNNTVNTFNQIELIQKT